MDLIILMIIALAFTILYRQIYLLETILTYLIVILHKDSSWNLFNSAFVIMVVSQTLMSFALNCWWGIMIITIQNHLLINKHKKGIFTSLHFRFCLHVILISFRTLTGGRSKIFIDIGFRIGT